MSNPIIVHGSAIVQGNAVAGQPDRGDSVKIGGRGRTTPPSAVDQNDRVDAHFDELGKLAVMIGGDGTTAFVTTSNNAADSADNNNNGLSTDPRTLLYNGTSWDRARNNIEVELLASTSRTASTNSSDQTNYTARGVIITLDVNTDPGGGETLQLLVQHKDSSGSNYETLLDDGANATPAERTVILYPGTAGSANDVTSTAGYPLPRTWRVRVVHSAGGTWAYSVAASYVL